jgi:hydroxymethylpyrimidine pyrophosphatase-like HAD family hydrolase
MKERRARSTALTELERREFMRYHALAADYDGTLATEGVVDEPTVRALERFVASGRRLVLVTGRELDQLYEVFPAVTMFERVVAENGALLHPPATGVTRLLGTPPPPRFAEELRRRGVSPLSVGRCIVATLHPHEGVVLELIRELGLELQVIFNKGSVMILPAGVNKATGLASALDELALSRHNVVAVGDAENDHALLHCAEFGVAVANALPTLKQAADRTTHFPRGAGVTELVDDVIASDLETETRHLARHRIEIGAMADGAPVSLPSSGLRLVIAGSTTQECGRAVSALFASACMADFQICVIDHADVQPSYRGAVVLGTREHPPSAVELASALELPRTCVVLNVAAVPDRERAAFLDGLLIHVHELARRAGRPHFLVMDEAHELGVACARAFGSPDLANVVVTTTRPDAIDPAIVARASACIAVGARGGEALHALAAKIGSDASLATVAIEPAPADASSDALLWSPPEAPLAFTIVHR